MSRRKNKTTRYTAVQPQRGEVMVHCGHPDAQLHHFLFSPRPHTFRRPDGSLVRTRWTVVCDGCWRRAGRDPSAVLVRGDMLWRGDGPVVEQTADTDPRFRDHSPGADYFASLVALLGDTALCRPTDPGEAPPAAGDTSNHDAEGRQ
jgi:hypothetical protein